MQVKENSNATKKTEIDQEKGLKLTYANRKMIGPN